MLVVVLALVVANDFTRTSLQDWMWDSSACVALFFSTLTHCAHFTRRVSGRRRVALFPSPVTAPSGKASSSPRTKRGQRHRSGGDRLQVPAPSSSPLGAAAATARPSPRVAPHSPLVPRDAPLHAVGGSGHARASVDDRSSGGAAAAGSMGAVEPGGPMRDWPQSPTERGGRLALEKLSASAANTPPPFRATFGSPRSASRASHAPHVPPTRPWELVERLRYNPFLDCSKHGVCQMRATLTREQILTGCFYEEKEVPPAPPQDAVEGGAGFLAHHQSGEDGAAAAAAADVPLGTSAVASPRGDGKGKSKAKKPKLKPQPEVTYELCRAVRADGKPCVYY